MDRTVFERMEAEMEAAMRKVAEKYEVELEFDDHFHFWLEEHVTLE